ncbi:MAG TPA: class I SAM-dependent methyltransferase [Methylomusa anaerophila]|uniref:Cyclopropane-fatty-acyl-phospholipid synthase n=1 Tax=Methylomusa anaerophila TaxID=1930071 RepID=A0A348ALU9_9FIRM|nr:class I SAM-dependent methyltransferase [Methylomusa anaerophila]BBB92047.1 cyclopropane-fatty-acyl-phospholipid synthase [Methylomusa anaerophila]HML87941.1 class I SAM-dependent methyltransferase [Methylomusa anaerophila]
MKIGELPFLQKQIIKALFGKIRRGGLRVRYWDGEESDYGDTAPRVKLLFNQCPASTLRFDDPVLSLGEAYMDGVLDYEGPLEDILLLLANNQSVFSGGTIVTKALKAIVGTDNRDQARRNIQHHYDLGNDFFALWLDETMSYSCAYFKHPTDSLYQAQLQKIDHILKKINIQPGETILDIGSGWGWLIIKAAQTYNAKALGITLSEEQYRATRERIAALGLTDKVDVQLINYLDLDEEKYRFDKIVSVGMFEHVGKENIPKYLNKINRLLVPGGLSLLHTITETTEDKPENTWMKTYIFPGGYVPSLRETIWQLPEHDFHLLHAESLRMHYAMTLDHWYTNFSQHLDDIQAKFDNRFVRMWGLYLKGSAAAFRATGLDIHQLLFSKGLNNELPLTLAHIYA